MQEFRVAFIGHRIVDKLNAARDELLKIVTYLIEHYEFVEFLVGKDGDFDDIAAQAVRRVQKDLGKANSFLVWVQPYEMAMNEYLEKSFDEIYLPPELYHVHYKGAIVARNKWMVDQCDLLIAYIKNKDGNAKKIFDYGIGKGKYFVNVADLLESE